MALGDTKVRTPRRLIFIPCLSPLPSPLSPLPSPLSPLTLLLTLHHRARRNEDEETRGYSGKVQETSPFFSLALSCDPQLSATVHAQPFPHTHTCHYQIGPCHFETQGRAQEPPVRARSGRSEVGRRRGRRGRRGRKRRRRFRARADAGGLAYSGRRARGSRFSVARVRTLKLPPTSYDTRKYPPVATRAQVLLEFEFRLFALPRASHLLHLSSTLLDPSSLLQRFLRRGKRRIREKRGGIRSEARRPK